MTIKRKIHNWLIIKLIGKKTVIANCEIEKGTVYPNENCIIINTQFTL